MKGSPVRSLTAQHILVSLDFSADADQALDFAIALAHKLQARLTLLHVVDTTPLGVVEGATGAPLAPQTTPLGLVEGAAKLPPSYWQEVETSIAQRMEESLKPIHDAGLQGETVIVHGVPFQAIINFPRPVVGRLHSEEVTPLACYAIMPPSVCCLLFVLLCPVVSVAQHAPYAGQQSREMKALSPAEIQGYLSGSGMGLAKAAELHHYPGPKHVLELAEQLHLTAHQRTQTHDLYASMRHEAIRLGTLLVEEERRLDHLFATQTITEDALEKVTATIARYHGQLRSVHLRAHLAQRRLLTTQQVQHYDALRGYTSETQHQHRHKH